MVWAILLTVVVVVGALALSRRFRRQSLVTAQELERRRRQLGIHDGKGSSFFDR